MTSRWIGSLMLVAVALGGIIRLAGWQGLWRQVRISGGSMAPSLVGEHFRLICRDCNAVIRYDAHDPPRDGRVICWNCTAVNDHRSQGPVVQGQRVLVDRWAYVRRMPQRWEVVALRDPQDPSRLAVKRIVGLPGERIEFRRGDLVASGRVVRKSLTQLRAMAVLVHDHDFQPPSDLGLPTRWQSPTPPSRWRASGSQFIFEPKGASSVEAVDWLVYHHWPGYAGPTPRAEPSPILDNDSFNQQLSRRLHTVTDVMLACRIRTPGRTGRLAFEIAHAEQCHRVELCFDRRRLVLSREATELASFPLPRFAFARGVSIEFAWCDEQLLFGIDGQELIREVIADSNASGPRIAIGTTGSAAVVDRLRIFRDVYYLPQETSIMAPKAPQSLGPSEVFVVGDNLPISQDSRHWPRPGLPIDRLLGRVWLWSGSR